MNFPKNTLKIIIILNVRDIFFNLKTDFCWLKLDLINLIHMYKQRALPHTELIIVSLNVSQIHNSQYIANIDFLNIQKVYLMYIMDFKNLSIKQLLKR